MAEIYFRPDGANRFQIRSAAGLTLPSAWLDQEFNRVYSYLNTIESGGATTGSEWGTVQVDGTRTSNTVFTVVGDFSAIFEALRAIRFKDDNDTYTHSHIKSSTYVGGTNLTTVTVYDAVVPTTIEEIAVGLIGTEAQAISSVNSTTRTAGYTIGANDQIVLVNDSAIGGLQLVYDDGQVNGNGYYALMITLPVASDVPGKLICVKKISGTYRTIVSSPFTHTSTTVGTETTHINTYNFMIYGDSVEKSRVTLYGSGDCYWLYSNGTRWYELTPEASETVKGVVRLATETEMTLTAQQIADNETLRRDVAVSPYQADKQFLRTDASNMHFASNYIYKAPNGGASLVNNNIVVYNGLGLNIPDGRDENGVIKVKQVELDANITYAPVEVTENRKLLFITAEKSVQPVLTKNYFQGYVQPTPLNTTTGDYIIWFDYGANLLKLSTDNGTNWTKFDGCGPICEYYGNGSYTTNIHAYAAIGFLTRDDKKNIEDAKAGFIATSRGISISSGYVPSVNGTVILHQAFRQNGNMSYDPIVIYIDGVALAEMGVAARDGRDGMWGGRLNCRVKAGQTITTRAGNLTFYPDL